MLPVFLGGVKDRLLQYTPKSPVYGIAGKINNSNFVSANEQSELLF